MAVNRLNQYKLEKEIGAKDKNEFVTCVIVNPDGQPLRLTRGKNQKLDPGKYDLCSGHMKTKGELRTHAMLRELEEELDISGKDIKEFTYLDDIETPHVKFLGTTTHFYYLITNLSEQELNQRLKQVSEPEMEKAEYLSSMQELMQQMETDKNWRILFTPELREQLIKVSDILEKRKQESKVEKDR